MSGRAESSVNLQACSVAFVWHVQLPRFVRRHGDTVRFAGAPTALCMLKKSHPAVSPRSPLPAGTPEGGRHHASELGSRLFSLRPAAEGAEAECFDCGTVIPNAVLRGANPEAFILPAASLSPVSASETARTGTPAI